MGFRFEDRTRALVAAIWEHGSIAAGAHSVGMDTSNARRHLRTAEGRSGVKLVESRRGGSDGTNTRVTPAGLRLIRVEGVRGIAGTYDKDAGVTPIHVGRRVLLAAGDWPAGPVALRLPPEGVVLSREAIVGASARNAFPVRVESITEEREGTYRLALSAGELRLDALVVRSALQALRIRKGSRLVASIKAVAVGVIPERPPRPPAR